MGLHYAFRCQVVCCCDAFRRDTFLPTRSSQAKKTPPLSLKAPRGVTRGGHTDTRAATARRRGDDGVGGGGGDVAVGGSGCDVVGMRCEAGEITTAVAGARTRVCAHERSIV